MNQRPNRSHWIKLLKEALRGKEYDYTQGPLIKAIFLLAIPMVFEMLMESVFALVDIYFVSKVSTNAVATIGLTESVVTLIYAVAVGISMAATAVVARRIGEAEEAYAWALSSLEENRSSDGVYHAYNARVRAAKALLTAEGAKTNSHHSNIEGFDKQFPNYYKETGKTFKAEIAAFESLKPEITFATAFVKETQSFIAWVKKERDAQ